MRLRDNSVAEMSSSVPRIAAIRGAPNRAIQDALRRFAHRWTDRGVRIAGLIETLDDMAEPTWQAVRLQNIRSGETYPLFQYSDRWPLPVTCRAQGLSRLASTSALRSKPAAICSS